MRFSGGTLQYVKIDTAAGSTVALVAGVTGKTTRVYAIVFTLASGTVKFNQGSTDLTGAMTLTFLNLAPMLRGEGDWQPHFLCASGAAFNLIFSGANQCSGYALYTQEPDGT